MCWVYVSGFYLVLNQFVISIIKLDLCVIRNGFVGWKCTRILGELCVCAFSFNVLTVSYFEIMVIYM